MASTNVVAFFFFFFRMYENFMSDQRIKFHEEICNPYTIRYKLNQAIFKMVLSLFLLNAFEEKMEG